MQRANYLMPQITALDNLYLAYYKANKGKTFDVGAMNYRKNLHANISLLQEQLFSGNVSVGNYHYFTICDPKVRLICAADFSERVLHHALMNICHPYFERQLIFNNHCENPKR